ncbi:MAG: hypothetical protein H7301_06920 [Cryobacterium sp.]|nr:hypothetical protein [Oligoflexia bacterium]
MEKNPSLIFSTQFFQASFLPYRVPYASEVHNPDNPDNPVIAVHAAIEHAFEFSTESSVVGLFHGCRDVSVGLKLRILERKYVHGTFSLIDVATKESVDYLPVRKQNTVLVDPSIAWVPAGDPWHLRMSLTAKNLGYSSSSAFEYPDYFDVGGGIGVSPPVAIGTLQVGVDFVDLIEASRIQDRLRLGVSY